MDASRAFGELVRVPQLDIDLARGALCIARIEHPQLIPEHALKQLDELAARSGAAGLGDALRTLHRLREFLFAEEGFRGNADDYYDPRNSCLNDVLERRLGIPITLALVTMEVGARVGLRIQGIGLPGHFVVGAQLDQGRAATLALILLAFALGAFLLQRRVVGRRAYTAMTGKGDAGQPAPLPPLVARLAFGLTLPWASLTILIYVMALVGGFAETWGRDYTPTLRHYAKAFSVEYARAGIIWSGAAWHSLWTTLELAGIAAPLTAALGLLTAYLLVRQRFAGRTAFELATMLSFAIPGTVIGVSYILAFNVPPIELTGTGIILVLCFVFRNMPVGVRAGMAAMSQIDPSLDEASVTLGGRGFATLRRVILPLLRPAVVAALVYSFVRAMTTVSAVVFLVTAEYDMATTYIINRVINGDYGVAIAYSSVLVLLMLAAIVLIQLLVGERRLRRRGVAPAPSLTGRAA